MTFQEQAEVSIVGNALRTYLGHKYGGDHRPFMSTPALAVADIEAALIRYYSTSSQTEGPSTRWLAGYPSSWAFTSCGDEVKIDIVFGNSRATFRMPPFSAEGFARDLGNVAREVAEQRRRG